MFTVEKLSDLRKAVRYAAPHADKTGKVPVLSGINFRVNKGSSEVIVAATDRFTLAMIPVPLSAPAPDDVDVTLPAKELTATLKRLTLDYAGVVVSEREDGHFVQVEVLDTDIAPFVLLPVYGGFPRNLARLAPSETETVESVALNPAFMARFAPAGWPGLPAPRAPRVDLTFSAPGRPIRVSVPDLPDMVGLVLPHRTSDGYGTYGSAAVTTNLDFFEEVVA